MRSPHRAWPPQGGAHPAGALRDRVFAAADLQDVKPIRAVTTLPGFKPSDQWPLAHEKVRHVGECIAVCIAPTRAEAEDLAEQVELEIEELPRGPRYAGGAARLAAHWSTRHWGDNLFLTSTEGGDMAAARAGRCGHRDARAANGTPGDEPARRPRRTRALGHAPRPARRHDLDAAAAHRPHRALGVPGHRPRPYPSCRARRRRRLRLQGHPAAGGDRARLGDAPPRLSRALARGPAREPDRRRQLPRAPLSSSPAMRIALASCSASSARQRSMRVPTRRIRSRPASKAAKSCPSFLGSTICRHSAPRPTRSQPTSRRYCPIAASRARVCALRSRCWSMRSRAN